MADRDCGQFWCQWLASDYGGRVKDCVSVFARVYWRPHRVVAKLPRRKRSAFPNHPPKEATLLTSRTRAACVRSALMLSCPACGPNWRGASIRARAEVLIGEQSLEFYCAAGGVSALCGLVRNFGGVHQSRGVVG